MSTSSPRPSERVLLQRVRNQLIDYLEIAASFEAQRDFQFQAPETHVATEVLEQWADWVSPNWQQELKTPTFSEARKKRHHAVSIHLARHPQHTRATTTSTRLHTTSTSLAATTRGGRRLLARVYVAGEVVGY